jgi:hypothetical protein
MLRWIRENMDPVWEDYDRRISDPRKLLAEIAARSADKTAVGFKHHLSAPRDITNFVLGLGRPKILLARNNFLAAYSSQKVVELTGQGAVRARRSSELVRVQVTFDPEEFAAFCAQRISLYANARAKSKGRKLEIDYVEARTDEGMAEIAAFLEVDPAGFGPAKTVKRNSDDIISRFQNASEVESYLRQNSLLHWAQEN